MRVRTINQKGFEAVFVGIALLFVAVIGFAGYKVMSMNKSAETAVIAPAGQSDVPETIKSKADLQKTDKALDASVMDVDKGLDGAALDADLDTLL